MKTITNLRPAKFAACTLGTTLVIFASPVVAQGFLEEIVVTAQRREESLQEVPIAISAFSENFLVETGITSTMDIAMVTPGLHYGTQLQGAVPFIRGVGNNGTSVGQDASVSTYVDEVYYSGSVGSVMSLNNIERLEVLKGPQGTLFGRNATGGLIHVITKNPSHETSGRVEISLGNYATTTGSFYGTTGITDKIAADLAVYYSNQDDGWGKNLTTGNDINLSEETMVRTKWLIQASENTEITLSADHSKADTNKGISQRPFEGSLGADGLATFAYLTTPIELGGAGLTPDIAAPIAAASATGAPDNFYDINSSIDPLAEIELWGGSAKIVHQMGDMELVSITAYRDFENKYTFAQPQVPMPNLLDPIMPEFTRTLTQELRLSSGNDNFNWIVGAYILDEEAGFDMFEITGLLIAPATFVTIDNEVDTFSWALFGQTSYSFTENTRLTTGIRYTDDQREQTGTTTAYAGPIAVAANNYNQKDSWQEFTWRLSLDHNFSAATMGYFSYNRGFKSGVFNNIVNDPVVGPSPAVEPEILDAYEIGFKSELIEGRLRLNGAFFYYEYENLQATVTRPGGATLINAAEVTIHGGELELNTALSENFQIHAGVSAMKSEFDSFPEGQTFIPTGFGGNAQVSMELGGNNNVRSPEFTGNIGFVYDIPSSVGIFTTSMNYYYNDGFFWEPENRIEQESYSLLNAQITWKNTGENVSLQLYGNNLTGEEYGMFGISGQLGDQLSAAAPRTYGVKLGINF